MNTNRKGTAKELATAALLTEQGYVVASRRHVPGPGDLLAVRFGTGVNGGGSTRGEVLDARLIEVKAGRAAYENFRPQDRAELRDYAEQHRLSAELCWWPNGEREPRWIMARDWPS